MIRTALVGLYLAIFLIVTSPALLMVKYYEKTGKKEKRDRLVENETRFWAKSMLFLTGAKIKVKGMENIPKNEPVVFISNHQSDYDILILLGYVDTLKGFVAKIETEHIPIISSWMRALKCVFMDRKNIKKAVEAINQGAEVVKSGYNLVIFPEGTRAKCNKMGEFKAGSFKLATKAKAKIVPITIKGSYKLFEEKGHFAPADVEVIISQAIDTSELSREETKTLHDKVYDIVKSNL